MKYLFSIMLLLLVNSKGVSQTIFFLCVIDPLDENIGSDVDKQHMQHWIRDMAYYSSMDLRETYLNLEEHSYRDLATAVRDLNPGSDDVVMFYYSGHGSRHCLDRNAPPIFSISPNFCVSQDFVHSQLLEKRPRMLLTIFDCCVDRDMLPSMDRTPFSIIERPRADSVAKLFRQFRGDIRVQSNDPRYGMLSYGNPELGGLYTTSFIDNFGRAVRGLLGSVSWDKILRATYFDVREEAAEQNKIQVPIYYSTLRPAFPTLFPRD